MGTTIREAQERIDAPEFSKWAAYYRLYPPNSANFYIAQLTAMVASMFRKEGEPAVAIEEFLLFGDRPAEPEETDDEKRQRIAESIERAMGAFAGAWKKNHPEK